MLKLVLLILGTWSITSKHRIKQYLRLLNVLDTWESEDGLEEIPVGDEVIPAPGVSDPGIDDYGWKHADHIKKTDVPMLGDSPLGDDPFGDFRDYFREKNPHEEKVGSVGELDLYDEDVSAFHEESPVRDNPVMNGGEKAVAGYWDISGGVGGYWSGYHGAGPGVKCTVGDDKAGWMPRSYTVHMLKLKASCAAECARAANCMAFSWDFSVPMNGRGQCTFKKGFDNRQLITSAGWGSWGTVVVRCPYRPKVDYYGTSTCRVGDYRSGYMSSSATMDIPKMKQECQLECMYSDRCMAFSWNFALTDTQMGVCHFKRWFNGNLAKKMDAWGSVVVRCPPTTTAKPGAGGKAAAPADGGAAPAEPPPAAELAVAHTTPRPNAKASTKKTAKSSSKAKKKSHASKKRKASSKDKGVHVEDPGSEIAVGASPYEEIEEH